MKKLRPILLLEVNEVHWPILDRVRETSSLARSRAFFDAALTRTTHCEDVGVLSPWITWPSLHRGMSNVEHGIQHLGQDVHTFRGRPIWEEYRRLGESIGICGSLQSWPPVDPGPGGFYVPDTFARDARCVPAHLDALQRLNLLLVRDNGRVRGREVPLGAAIAALPAALRARVSPAWFARTARQLIGERLDPARAALRPTFQTLLFWDVFKGLFDPRAPPAFSTFFTNHVASVLHRHLDELFPEEFGGQRRDAHSGVIAFAFEVLDEILGDALALQRARPDLLLVFASSMGQAAVVRDRHSGRELTLRHPARLLKHIGIPESAYALLLAMVPQVAVEVPDGATRDQVARALHAIRSASGRQLFRVESTGACMTLTLGTPLAGDLDRGFVTMSDGHQARWDALGIEVTVVAPGTGNHVPEGSLAVVGAGIPRDPSRTSMRATEVKAMLLELAGLPGASS